MSENLIPKFPFPTLYAVILAFGLCFCPWVIQAQSQYVNPMVGTDGHGHTFPGAVLPFGMIQISPDTRIDGSWDGCSGYHYSDSLIYGFSHTHLSGTGVSDYGDFLLMPSSGSWSLDPAVYRAPFRHSDETAAPGYYSVRLGNGVDVELVAGLRAGMHRYHFAKGQPSYVLLDLMHRDKLLEGRIERVDDYRWKMMRRSDAWAKDQHCYGWLEFSRPAKVVMDSASCKMVWSFDCPDSELWVKVAISGVDQEGARRNLEVEMRDQIVGNSLMDSLINQDQAPELRHWTCLRKAATQTWDKALGVIEIEDAHTDRIRTFYTALYHCMIHPSLASDADGRYRGRDQRIHQAEGFDYYSVFSLWDTYRALHPLLMLIDTVRTRHFIQTFLEQYRQAGRLPVWEFASNETNCMIGYHSVSVMADAAVKGLKGIDWSYALQAMLHSANQDYEGIAWLRDHGHLSVESCSESVSKNLEYAYDDWCIAQMAALLGDSHLSRQYLNRSGSWRNLLDSASGMMRPRKNGQWLSPFDPREVNNHFTEANAWQTSFYVPHDIQGWVEAVGGPHRAEAVLDTLFETNSATSGREQADITGLIGQYAHGNEPSHHIAYLYHYLGRPDKTLRYVRRIQHEFYSDKPDGLIGNEDCGQMSAWYVLSSLGLYSLTPGSTEWMWSVPAFGQIRLKLPNGRLLELHTDTSLLYSTSWPRRYLQKRLQKPALSIEHKQLMEGGRWDMRPPYDFEGLGLQAPDSKSAVSKSRISEPADLDSGSSDYLKPRILPRGDVLPALPLIEAASAMFGDSLEVQIHVQGPHSGIRYARGSKNVLSEGISYQAPLILYSSDTLTACALDASGKPGFVVTAHFNRVDPRIKVDLKFPYNRQYHAGGPLALVDGVEGDLAWRKGDWHGYQGHDFEAVIHLPEPESLNVLEAGFLQDVRSWIVFPESVEVWGRSTSDQPWKSLGTATHSIPVDQLDVQRKNIVVQFSQPMICSDLQIRAKQYGPLPAWHPGAGGQSFIFVDEVRWR